MVAERLNRPYADFAAGVTQAGDAPRGRGRPRARGHGARPRASTHDGTPVHRAAGAAARAAAPLAARARGRAGSPRARRGARRRCGATLRFFGPGESQVAQASPGGRRRRRRARGDDLRPRASRSTSTSWRSRAPRRALPSSRPRSRSALGALPLSADGRAPVEEIVLDRCRARGWTLATAESCTGGLVAARLTAIPGSSDVVTGGIVAYANEVKIGELGVPAELIEEHGAVSAEVGRGDGARRARAARRRRRGLGDGRRRPGRRHARRSRSGSSTSTRTTPTASMARGSSFPGDRDSIRAPGGRRRRCISCGDCWHRIGQSRVSSAASVDRDERLRLFLALRLPDDAVDALAAWQARDARRGGSSRPRTSTSRSRSSAPGPPASCRRSSARSARGRRGAAPLVLDVAATARRGASGCSCSTTRRARRRARRARCTSAWSELGVYQRERAPWLPHVTVLRFRERPRLRPAAARLGQSSVRRGCFPFTSAPVRGAVRGARIVFALGG